MRLGRKITRPEREGRVAEMKKFWWLLLFLCFLGSMLISEWVKAGGVTIGITANSTSNNGNVNVNANYDSMSATAGPTFQNRYLLQVHGYNAGSAGVINSFSKNNRAINTHVNMNFTKPDNEFGCLNSEEKIGVAVVNANPTGPPGDDQTGEYFEAVAGSGLAVTELDEFDSTGTNVSGNETSTSYNVEGKGEGSMKSGLAGTYQKYQYKELVSGEGMGPWGEPPCIRRATSEWVQTEDMNIYYVTGVSGQFRQTGNYTMGIMLNE